MNKSELITIRDFLPNDRSFVLATWLRGLYYGESWFSEVPKQIFMENYHKVLEHKLEDKNTHIRVACLIENPDVILGYSVLSTSNDTAHWVFIKKNWRGIGLAKDLVPPSVTSATHLTAVGLSITRKKGIKFNPFII